MGIADLDRRAPMIARDSHDLGGLYLAFDAELRELVPYTVAAWTTHDPATGKSSAANASRAVRVR